MAKKTLPKVRKHISARWHGLRMRMRAKGLDGYLATGAADVSYLSGFRGEDSYLLVGRRAVVLISDSRFAEQARKECPGIRLVERKSPITDAASKLVQKSGLGRVGFEPGAISQRAYKKLGKALGAKCLVQAEGMIQRARKCKDAAELRAIRRSIGVAENALEAILGWIKPGMTELEVAGQLELEMKIRGSSQPAFATIVACGTRTSMPHVQPSRKRVQAGRPVLIDWGATVGGYRSDLTRVIFLGSISRSFRSLYETVLRASRAGMDMVKAGRPAKQVDSVAREVIVRAGWGEYFGHGLGHGIGQDIHEGPLISSRSPEILEEGMVFTIEPGIYLPGCGGIRIENDVQVTGKGCRVLSRLPDDLAWAVRPYPRQLEVRANERAEQEP